MPTPLIESTIKQMILPENISGAQAIEFAQLTKGVILKKSSTRHGSIGVFVFNEKDNKVDAWILSNPDLPPDPTLPHCPATTEYLTMFIGDLSRVKGPRDIENARKSVHVVPSVPGHSASAVAPTASIGPEVSEAKQIGSRFRSELHRMRSVDRYSNLVICSDFDGTATQISGGDLVRTELYRTLLSDSSPLRKYNDLSNPIRPDIQDELRRRFGPYKEPWDCYERGNSQMLMTKEAVAFYHTALASPHSDLIIVTKNRADYVQALFEYHGFTPEEMAKLKIRSQHTSDKAGTLRAATDGSDGKAITVGPETKIYVFDDDSEDYASMMNAFQSSGASIQGHREAPGQFKWEEYRGYLERDIRAHADTRPSI